MKSCLPLLLFALGQASYQTRIDEALAAGTSIDLPTWETAVLRYWDTILQFKDHVAVVAAFVAYESEKCIALKRPWNLASRTGEGKVLFVKIDVSVPDFQMQPLLSKYDFRHPPFIFVMEKGQKKGLPFKEPPTEENLTKLVDRLKKGEKKPLETTAPILAEPVVLPATDKSEL